MRLLHQLVLTAILLGLPAAGWPQSPSVDYASLLTGVQVNENGNILIDKIVTVFAPRDAIHTGAANEPIRFNVTLSSNGKELQRLPHILIPVDGVFGRLQAMGPPPIFKLSAAGPYEIDVLFDDHVIASLPFTAEFSGGR